MSEVQMDNFSQRWLIAAAAAAIALIGLGIWLPEPFAVRQAEHLRVLDAEHDALCRKYGVREPEILAACKRDILELRNRQYEDDMFI